MLQKELNNTKSMLTVHQIVSRYRVTHATVNDWIESGELYAIDARKKNSPNAAWRIDPDDFAKFLAKRSNADRIGSKQGDWSVPEI